MTYRLPAIAAGLLLVTAVLVGCAGGSEIATTTSGPTTTLAANPTGSVTETTAAPITSVAPGSTVAPTVTTATPTTVAPTTTHGPKTTATPTRKTAVVSAAGAACDAEVQARAVVAYLAGLVVSGNVRGAGILVVPEAQGVFAEMVRSLSDPTGYRIAGIRSSAHCVVVTVSFEDSKGTKSFAFTVRIDDRGAVVTGIGAR